MPRTAKADAALKPSRTRKAKTQTDAAAPEVVAPVEVAAEPLATPTGKLGVLVGLLRREEGATLADLQAATGWQAHSVRGAIAGSLKKKLGLAVTSAKIDGVRTYGIAA